MKNENQKDSVKSKQKQNQEFSDEMKSEELPSQGNDQQDEYSVHVEPQKITKPLIKSQESQQNKRQRSSKQHFIHQQQQEILQQQVQTDDFDLDDSANIVVQQIKGQSPPEQSFHSNKLENKKIQMKVQKIIEEKQEKNKQKASEKDNLLQVLDNSTNQKLKQNPSEGAMIEQAKQKKKKKKEKKNKKDKTKLDTIPEHDNIQERLQKMDIQEETAPKFPVINEQSSLNNFSQPEIKQQEEQQDSANPFYEFIHPYLMLVGSSIIESYMGKKPSYKSNEASQWASQLSSKVLLNAYFDGLDEPENFEQEHNKTIKNSIIQSKIQQNKFYRKIQAELNQLAQNQSFTKIPLSKVYFIIKKFKIIASCIILEKKLRAQATLNISTSCYWNKQKDGQINFSYQGKNCFVMLTLYGVENTRQQKEENDEMQGKYKKR